MNNYTKLYWLTRLDSIQDLCLVIGVLSVISMLIYYISIGMDCFDKEDRDDHYKSFGKILKIGYPLLIISALICTFLPNKNEAILIIAGGKTMDFVQQDSSLSKIPAQTTQIISDYLDKQIKETKESKENKK